MPGVRIANAESLKGLLKQVLQPVSLSAGFCTAATVDFLHFPLKRVVLAIVRDGPGRDSPALIQNGKAGVPRNRKSGRALSIPSEVCVFMNNSTT